MRKVIVLLLALGTCVLAVSPDKGDLTAEASQQKIYDIIQSHENRKYGDHGGHEYEEGEIAQKQASGKRYGYLPLNAEVKAPVYYDSAPKYAIAPKDNIYRENVAAYAPKPAPVHLTNIPHQVVPSQSHYAIVDPITKNHQYVTFEAPKPQYVVHPKSTYILEEEPHYVVPHHQKIVAKPALPHYLPPAKDYSHHHLLDKSHHASDHGQNSVYGESGHKSHKNHDISGHKSHSTSAGHHDEHDHHHNKAHYERDRGYHYEKSYAYDRVRAHHDIGSNKGSHSDYRAHHGQEGHKDAGSHGAHGYSYFQKQDKAGHHGQGRDHYDLQYLSPHHHAYGK